MGYLAVSHAAMPPAISLSFEIRALNRLVAIGDRRHNNRSAHAGRLRGEQQAFLEVIGRHAQTLPWASPTAPRRRTSMAANITPARQAFSQRGAACFVDAVRIRPSGEAAIRCR